MTTHAWRRKLLLDLCRIFDVAVMAASFLVGVIAVQQGGPIPISQFLRMHISLQNVLIMLGLVVIWVLILSGFGLYRSRRFIGLRSEVVDVSKASVAATVVVCAAAVILKIDVVTTTFTIIFFSVLITSMLVSRVAIRLALYSARRRGRNLRNLLIAGTNQRAIGFARKVANRPDFGYCINGFIDDPWLGLPNEEQLGYRLVCRPGEIRNYLKSNVVDEIVIALPEPSQHSVAASIAAACEEQGIIVRYLAFNSRKYQMTAEEFDGDVLIRNAASALEGWAAFIKRTVDFTLAGAALVILSPLFLGAAVAVRCTSKGSVFFCQERVGLNKRRFRLYKFRTMVVDAEQRLLQMEHLNEVSGPVFKMKNDPRITPVGHWLRKSSIDELPQLFNVLKGDMSLVGPRPLPLRDYEGFSEDPQRRRLSVLPGITCLWQVRGRSGIPFEEWMRLDLQYVDSWSLGLDLKILLMTIPVVLRGNGAA